MTLPVAARVYVLAIVIVAVAVLLPVLWISVDWTVLVVLAALYALCESVGVVPHKTKTMYVSVGFPVALAGVIMLPPSGAALMCLLGVVAQQIARRPPWVKTLFNAACFALSVAASGYVYGLLGGRPDLGVEDFPAVLLPLCAAATVFCLTNGLLLAGVLVTAEGMPFGAVWRMILSTSVVSYLGYGLIGLMMAVLWKSELGVFAAVLVLLPLFVARWTFAQYAQQQAAYDATVRTLVQAVETKDYYTRGHSERVSKASVMIAQQIGMREDRVTSLRYAGILHDVGKLGVPTRLLQKSGALTQAEFEAIQLHPVRGVELVREIEFLGEAYAGIMHHHERLDGRGYPMGLAGDQIPEFARVIAVADAFDSMTSTRSYRKARSVSDALDELERCAGVQFDSTMVKALLASVHEHGWEPADTPAPRLGDEGAQVARYDHDDPTASLPVVNSGPP
jgi:hypothetical protein